MAETDKAREQVEAKLRLLPSLPGVYLFKGAAGEVLYVGKAKRLNARVASYFTGEAGHPKTRALVDLVRDLDTIVTDTEMEALLLEITLIQQHQPPYNINLKDNKSYPFIRVSVQDPVPQLSIMRRPTSDGARYFGPFTEVRRLRETLRVLRTAFPVRTCAQLPEHACFNYHIGRCVAPCDGHVTHAAHRAIVDDLISFLSGNGQELMQTLRDRMESHAAAMRYEDAARVRDQMRGLQKLLAPQNVAILGEYEADALGFTRDGNVAILVVLKVRDGHIVGSEHSRISGVAGRDDADVLESALTQHYARTLIVPPQILVPTLPPGHVLLTQWLAQRAGRQVTMRVPERGRGAALVRMAARNALHLFEGTRGAGSSSWVGDLPAQQLAQSLGLPGIPRRIEGYDVSNLGGTLSCVSLVTFAHGEAKKSAYRTFRIRDIEGQNDFAMLQQALTRRFSGRLAQQLPDPDLVLVDGGAGQVHAAADALAAVGKGDLPLLGLAKREEEIYVWRPGVGVAPPIRLSRRSAGLTLLQRVRDEAHRRAVGYNRTLRRPTVQRSALENVPGLGPRRVRALLIAFGSLDGVYVASEAAIAALPGFGPALAHAVAIHVQNLAPLHVTPGTPAEGAA